LYLYGTKKRNNEYPKKIQVQKAILKKRKGLLVIVSKELVSTGVLVVNFTITHLFTSQLSQEKQNNIKGNGKQQTNS
jgi:hypothetical protein